jgi:hypothetical protein
VNTGAPWPDLDEAELRVRAMQTKLHQWATSDPGRRFDDLFNLVYDPAFLVTAWNRVRGTRVHARPGLMVSLRGPSLPVPRSSSPGCKLGLRLDGSLRRRRGRR